MKAPKVLRWTKKEGVIEWQDEFWNGGSNYLIDLTPLLPKMEKVEPEVFVIVRREPRTRFVMKWRTFLRQREIADVAFLPKRLFKQVTP